MRKTLWVLLAGLVIGGSAAAQDATAVWNAIAQPAFDAGKSAVVENVRITRDRIQITLQSGAIQFGQAANGVVFAAAFEGRGRIQIAPPNDIEKQQLQLLAKVDTINFDFTEATFSFTDPFFDEVAEQVKW